MGCTACFITRFTATPNQESGAQTLAPQSARKPRTAVSGCAVTGPRQKPWFNALMPQRMRGLMLPPFGVYRPLDLFLFKVAGIAPASRCTSFRVPPSVARRPQRELPNRLVRLPWGSFAYGRAGRHESDSDGGLGGAGQADVGRPNETGFYVRAAASRPRYPDGRLEGNRQWHGDRDSDLRQRLSGRPATLSDTKGGA